jgi:hypothetical protein
MKLNFLPRSLNLLGLTLICFTAHGQGFSGTDTNAWTNSFPIGNNTTYFQNDGMAGCGIYWSTPTLTLQGDPTMDARTNTNSGSCMVTLVYGPGTNGEAQWFYNFDMGSHNGDSAGVIPLSLISGLACDIYVTNTIPLGGGGGPAGQYSLGLVCTTGANGSFWSDIEQGPYIDIPASASGHWVHITNGGAAWTTYVNAQIAAGYPYACAILLEYDNYSPMGSVTYPFTNTFWIDNLAVVIPSVVTAPPPPRLGVAPAAPGLTVFSSATSSAGGVRENIANHNEFSWVNAGGPVSYSFTINSWPVPVGDQLSVNLYLIQNAGAELGANGYDEANVVEVTLGSLAAGGVTCALSFKTNAPNSYVPAAIATITNSKALGTWSLTFNSPTNFTLSGPGVSTNANIPDPQHNIASAFASGVSLYLGVTPINNAACNDRVSFSDINVTGIANAFDDNCINDDGYLNSMWTINGDNNQCIQPVPSTGLCWVYWTEPATGFSLCVAPNLTSPITNAGWYPAIYHSPFNASTNYYQLVDQYDLPDGSSSAFFAVINP